MIKHNRTDLRQSLWKYDVIRVFQVRSPADLLSKLVLKGLRNCVKFQIEIRSRLAPRRLGAENRAQLGTVV